MFLPGKPRSASPKGGRIFSVCLFVACLASLASPPAQAAQNPIAKAFSLGGIPTFNPAPTTFIFWINGDADHFVTAGTETGGEVIRSDKIEVARLLEAARGCTDCNVFVYHEQRGGSKWYRNKKPWAHWLRVIVRGKKILERAIPTVNGADPAFLSAYLRFAAALAPDSEMHFIYRGHSFQMPYDPLTAAHDGITPFVRSNPEQPYGVATFASSFTEAHLPKKLSSITLAACSMAYVETATALIPYAHHLLASEVDVLETLNTGIDYEWLRLVGKNAQTPVDLIFEHLMDRFDATLDTVDALTEYPLTAVDLDRLSEILPRWQATREKLRELRPELASAFVQKRLSDRYLRMLEQRGKPPQEIDRMFQSVAAPSDDPGQMDVIAFLDAAVKATADASLMDDIQKLREGLLGSLRVSRNSSRSGKFGLSLKHEGQGSQ